MERLKSIKDCLIAQVSGQMGKLDQVDAKELGEVVDMIKDMEEACYYAKITEAMEKAKKKKVLYRILSSIQQRLSKRYGQGLRTYVLWRRLV